MTNSKRAIEMILVILPAMSAILFAESWVSTDAIAYQAVIWVVYVVMLAIYFDQHRCICLDPL